jgi:threonine synthase
MDIQVASNFERLLFEACGRDAKALRGLMQNLEQDGRMILPEGVRNFIAADFRADSADENEVADKIQSTYASHNMLIDPHTAVGLVTLDKLRKTGQISGTVVSLSTAHPAKFPESVKAACGIHPELPDRYADLMINEETFLTAPADASEILEIILERSIFG